MATFPCENKSLCVDPATPFQNFSAEAPDGHISIARSTGFGPAYPPLGSDFFAVGCTVFCESTESQQDADLCANRNWVECVSVVWPVWRPVVDVFGNRTFAPGPRQVFVNSAQTATVFCPDGNPFSYTVPAGRYSNFSQAAADESAFSDALEKAEEFKVCITNLSRTQICADSAYNDSVTAIGKFLNTDTTCWQIFGQLPPGINTDLDLSFQGCLTGDNTFHFFGAPTVPGDYSFSIQVTDDVGSFMVKPVTIRVMGITTTSLPNGVPFNAYSAFVEAAGVTNPIFSIESGTLPAGLAFDTASGEIFGTPIAPEMQTLTFSVTEAGTGLTCVGDPLSINIVSTINFNDLIWGAPNIFTQFGGTASGSALNNGGNAQAMAPGPDPSPPSGQCILTGVFPYTGPAVNCVCHVTAQFSEIGSNASVLIQNDSFSLNLLFNAVGDFPFTVPDSIGDHITVTINVNADGTNAPTSANLTMNITPAF